MILAVAYDGASAPIRLRVFHHPHHGSIPGPAGAAGSGLLATTASVVKISSLRKRRFEGLNGSPSLGR